MGSVAVVGAGVDGVARERSGSSEDMTDVPIWVMRSRRDEGEKRECLFGALSSEELGLRLLDDDPEVGGSDSVISLELDDSVAVDALDELAEPDGSGLVDLESGGFESELLDEPAAEYDVEDGDAGLAGSDIIWIRRSRITRCKKRKQMQVIDGLVLGVKDSQKIGVGKINKSARKISSVRFFLINNTIKSMQFQLDLGIRGTAKSERTSQRELEL